MLNPQTMTNIPTMRGLSKKLPKTLSAKGLPQCSLCGQAMPSDDDPTWLIYKTWTVFSEDGQVGPEPNRYLCPECAA
jgi:hypothetical protein